MDSRRSFLKSSATLVAAGILTPVAPALAATARFEADGSQFLLDGKPFQILAGEMHYPRIPRACWRDRMRKLKAMGLNTLTTYVFWNAHEPTPGHYNFSDNLDIAAYIRMAQEEGLWVNLRPGPYVCAEWDGGGFPAWLLPTPDIQPRSTDPRYFKPVQTWLKRLGQELTPLLIDKGGPIILTQVENEYGAFGKDQNYLAQQMKALRAAGFAGMLYTADPAEYFANGSIPGLVGGINFGTMAKAEKEFADRAKVRPTGPYFCSELWGGWFDSFGRIHETMPTQPLIDSLKWMLEHKYSISFYMLHGGTSFGFTAGANWNKDGYQPQISSYDYDALLDEAGRPTPKYLAVQALFKAYLPADTFAPMPEPEKAISLPRFRLTQGAALDQLLPAPVTSTSPQTLEALGQNNGLVLYRHTSKTAAEGKLRFGDVRDYAIVGVNGRALGALDRRYRETGMDVSVKAGDRLDILVDTMGHCNYGANIGKDQKGLIGDAKLGDAALTGWDHFSLPLDNVSKLAFSTGPSTGPAFYRATFTLAETGYTFLDMRGWGKGHVWINGHNLGRYWSVGPQQALFVPASWLKTGENEVIVLDLHPGADRSLAASPKQIWDLPGSGL
ncbi:beta-galactosidase [Asticcacaulis sp. 201]|uniref:beta-galactosidase n=1 Tax=Asticcacaulis sp. 201 TaxID=3028787 RepID=UPI0029164648|nr:beta-galactosidase [Asticcacaulis sp. 201]MDV6330892.1 beta-galactosidase [Asticcacaulis sp. 201]